MVPRRIFPKSIFLASALVLGLAGCGAMKPSAMKPSNMVTLTAQLSSASEVPPTVSSGTGTADAWLNKDTNVLKWKVSFSGLTGPATAAHFHGPAARGAKAGVVFPFTAKTRPL